MKKKIVLVITSITVLLLCGVAVFFIKGQKGKESTKNNQTYQDEQGDTMEDEDTEQVSDEEDLSAIVQQYTFDESSPMPQVVSVDGGEHLVTQDSLADDGYALKGTTSFSNVHSGIKIEFDNIPIDTLDYIWVKFRTSDYVDIMVNDFKTGYFGYKNYSEYRQIDILPFLLSKGETSLKSLQIGRKTLRNVEVYIDSITMVDVDYNKVSYTFSKSYDMNVVSPLHADDGATYEMVRDEKAKDGYALKVTTESLNKVNGVQIDFDNLDLSLYDGICVRVRTKGSGEIYVNGVSHRIAQKEFQEYTYVDILPFLKNNGETQLQNIIVGAQMQDGVEIYIDEILFFESEE